MFGVIEERCICIVLDVDVSSESSFRTYLHALAQVLKEQVMFIAKFNLIRYLLSNYQVASDMFVCCYLPPAIFSVMDFILIAEALISKTH